MIWPAGLADGHVRFPLRFRSFPVQILKEVFALRWFRFLYKTLRLEKDSLDNPVSCGRKIWGGGSVLYKPVCVVISATGGLSPVRSQEASVSLPILLAVCILCLLLQLLPYCQHVPGSGHRGMPESGARIALGHLFFRRWLQVRAAVWTVEALSLVCPLGQAARLVWLVI